ncbi:class I SAM-dependent rRNA methyltransferase [Roseococcus sp. SDR]|uniref:class I SAM-dependent rRNA methyltransferase n=1 Tax=Roseococcus sp. SDR TaxID=2835532 RepID=UPI001BCD018A|nr:class I SAM-dependent rRNA methyltransferase [Roseococcus sp. SDR]MBS7788494.1 class I SAM-dependent rRNA methyltransferase [Roseococcus sp. SDR]MBV1843808.1 class I SAM-dependent rRNA methyltransferase [Roseococcus sp. SDR]
MTPLLRLQPGRDRRVKSGHPWAYSNEIVMDAAARALPPGSAVRLEGDDGVKHGIWHFNPHSLIAARVLDRGATAAPDAAWFTARIGRALALRERLGVARHCRLAHAEADGLPGLIIDRFDDVVAIQANTAGMEAATPLIVEALRSLLNPRSILARNDSAVRGLEGLPLETKLLHGSEAEARVEEGGLAFAVDLLSGQKTGWFFDQRENRARVAALAEGATMLDAFCHTGGFGLMAAKAGARQVTLLDRSQPALDLALASAAANGLADRVTARRGEALETLERMIGAGERFDVVVADPPAFAKSRKDIPQALRAYQRLARICAQLVNPGGFLFIASCSHHASPPEFAAAVAEGVWRARREARLLASVGAGPDHPVHPMLPESAYLKGQLLQLA